MAPLKLPVPTHLFTGTLGAGKTTAIAALIRAKPEHETWAVLVNEFGSVGIDAALLEGASSGGAGGVTVKQLAGGCLCCALSGVTSVAIAQLVRTARPSRLLIEPSGLGHPATLLDILRGEHLRTALDVQPVVCLVDATQFQGGGAPALSQPQVADQISLADIVLGSKADACDEATLAAFHSWAEGLYPPKQAVATCGRGQIDAELLLGCAPSPSGGAEAAPHQVSPPAARRPGAGAVWLNPSEPQGLVRREANQDGAGTASMGWVWASAVFDRTRLAQLLAGLAPRVARVKGIWRVGARTWVAREGEALVEVAYRRDSRMEVILRPAAAAAAAAAASGQQGKEEEEEEEPAAGSPGTGSPAGNVAAAVGRAAEGDWEPLEALLAAAVAAGGGGA